MSEIVIAGIGMTPVGEHWATSLRELALEAIEKALHEVEGLRPQAVFVANMHAPVLSRQANVGPLVADFAGFRGVEAATVEAGGASGGMALRAAYLAVASGEVDAALAVGVEKATDRVGAGVESAAATVLDADYEAEQGVTPAVQAALIMQHYMQETGAPREAFAAFPLLAHQNAVGNPYAMYRKAVKESVYHRVTMVSDPLNLFDAAPLADGAAAVLVARRDALPPQTAQPLVKIAGFGVANDTLAWHDRDDLLDFAAVRRSVEAACRRAGCTPAEVDFFELYDAFSVYVPLILEAAGFAPRGEGWKMGQTDALTLDGSLPILTMGGLKARGNPGGATGLYQVAEAVLQLRGQAGDNQIPRARRGLVQSLSGPASLAVTTVLEAV